METKYDAIVIGAGPGGYPCGIRLGQLGKKTLVIEKHKAGGVCLNVGCIPSKSIIQASKTYEKLSHTEKMGISVKGATLDVPKLIAWKDEVVGKLTTGVKGLLKAAGAEFVQGEASFVTRRRSTSRPRTAAAGLGGHDRGRHRLAADRDPGLHLRRQAHPRLDRRPGLPEPARAAGRDRRRLHRARARDACAKLGSKVMVVEATASLLPGNDPELVQVVARS